MMNMGDLLYEGKAKKIYTQVSDPEQLVVEYKDSLTAFNAQKLGNFNGKGKINRDIASLIFRILGKNGVSHHWVEDHGETYMICRRVSIIPLEVVVRNRLAGSTAKKFGIEEGTTMAKPLVEFYYKSDALADPFISDDQALFLRTVERREQLDELRERALKINASLQKIFSTVGLELIDFKVEFGFTSKGEVILADEITPDCCRLWDMKTGEKMDKDRFRRDLGGVEETYREVWRRLKEKWGANL